MIKRLNIKIGPELKVWMQHLIPIESLKSTDTTFHIDDIAGYELIEVLIDMLNEYGHSIENISKRISASSDNLFIIKLIQQYFMDTYKNIRIDEVESFKLEKFDWGISIPMISKTKDSEIFINESFNKYKEGLITMITAKPLIDKGNKSGDAKILKRFNTDLHSLVFIKPSIFGKDSKQTPLAFIQLKQPKDIFDLMASNNGKKKIYVLDTTKSNGVEVYDNVAGINILFGKNETALSIIDKLKKQTPLGSIMNDRGRNVSKPKKYRLNFSKTMGHIGFSNTTGFFKNDFYSNFPKKSKKGFGLITIGSPKNDDGTDSLSGSWIYFSKKEYAENCKQLLKSRIAKLGYMWAKYDLTVDYSRYNYVPLWDFTKPFDDKEYAEMIGLTKKELYWIDEFFEKN
jgi:hypothetical protein